jgi:hypothetical protein
MAELEIKNPQWDKGKCALWHKPCKEARADCNLWKELPVAIPGPLGIPQRGTAHVCIIFAIFEKVQQPLVVSAPVPNASPAQKIHIPGS